MIQLENYLYEDDIIIKSEILISIFKNIKKISDSEFLNHYDNTLKKYLETNFPSENINFRDKVFFTIIEEIAKNNIEEKLYHSLVKNFIKRFIMINDILWESRDSSYFKNSTKIYSKVFDYLEEINTIFKIHNDQNFMTDFISFLIKVIFELGGSIQTIGNNSNNSQNINNSPNLINLNLEKITGGPSINYFNYFNFFYLIYINLYSFSKGI